MRLSRFSEKFTWQKSWFFDSSRFFFGDEFLGVNHSFAMFFFERNSPLERRTGPFKQQNIEACRRENLWNVSLQLFWGQVPSEISTYGFNSAIGACERAGKWETFGSAVLLGRLVGWLFLGHYCYVATTMVLHDRTRWKQRAIFRRTNCSTLKAWRYIWRGSWET